MSMIRVLIVDDSSTMRAMLTSVLQADLQLEVAVAAGATDADRILDDEIIDVITLDQEMPGMSGLDYLGELHMRSSIPVIMLSAGAAKGAELRVAALRAGAVGCFDKADAVRRGGDLIKLIKAAALNKAKVERDDAIALKRAA